jgi:hypothetical protein
MSEIMCTSRFFWGAAAAAEVSFGVETADFSELTTIRLLRDWVERP